MKTSQFKKKRVGLAKLSHKKLNLTKSGINGDKWWLTGVCLRTLKELCFLRKFNSLWKLKSLKLKEKRILMTKKQMKQNKMICGIKTATSC